LIRGSGDAVERSQFGGALYHALLQCFEQARAINGERKTGGNGAQEGKVLFGGWLCRDAVDVQYTDHAV